MSGFFPIDPMSRSRVWYRRLLALYPGAFRERYASEMLQVFDESWSRVRDAGTRVRWQYWLHVVADVIKTVPGEWLAATPLLTKLGAIAMLVELGFFATQHQFLTVGYWIFFNAFAAICFALLLIPSRQTAASSILYTLALSLIGSFITKRLPGVTHNFSKHDLLLNSLLISLPVAVVVLIAYRRIFNRRQPSLAVQLTAGSTNNPRLRFLLAAVCAWVPLIFSDQSEKASHALFFLSFFLIAQFWAIWKNSIEIA